MKFSPFVLASLLPVAKAMGPSFTFSDNDEGGPADSCTEQHNCVSFSYEEVVEADPACSGDCYFRVCMTLDTSIPECSKDGAMSHYCDYGDVLEQCYGEYTLQDASDPSSSYHVQCLNVAVGETATFILKDGQQCSNSVGAFAVGDGGATASCQPTGHDGSDWTSCTGNGAGMECEWSVQVPSVCSATTTTSTGGAGGDPHFKRWNRKSFQFHGECDLVLLHSDHVNGDKPMDIHIRTVVHDWWSQIESAAMRVGDVTFQVDADDKLFLNGEEIQESDLPIKTGEFDISEAIEGAAHHLTDSLHGDESNVLRTYAVVLNDLSVVTFKLLGGLLTVSVKGHRSDFGQATGLMGDFDLGKPYTRAGERMYDLDAFAFEWQVNPSDDPILFNEIKGPQLPEERCRMPDVAKTVRNLRSQADKELQNAANDACASKGEEFDACVWDVLATRNPAMALMH